MLISATNSDVSVNAPYQEACDINPAMSAASLGVPPVLQPGETSGYYSTPAWSDALNKNFAALRALRAGWDGPRSSPVNRNLLNIADRLMKDVLEGIPLARAPYVVPTRDGSIQLEWHTARFDFEILLSEDVPTYAWLHDRSTQIEAEGEGDKAIDLVFRWARRVATPAGNEFDETAKAVQETVLLAA